MIEHLHSEIRLSHLANLHCFQSVLEIQLFSWATDFLCGAMSRTTQVTGSCCTSLKKKEKTAPKNNKKNPQLQQRNVSTYIMSHGDKCVPAAWIWYYSLRCLPPNFAFSLQILSLGSKPHRRIVSYSKCWGCFKCSKWWKENVWTKHINALFYHFKNILYMIYFLGA